MLSALGPQAYRCPLRSLSARPSRPDNPGAASQSPQGKHGRAFPPRLCRRALTGSRHGRLLHFPRQLRRTGRVAVHAPQPPPGKSRQGHAAPPKRPRAAHGTHVFRAASHRPLFCRGAPRRRAFRHTILSFSLYTPPGPPSSGSPWKIKARGQKTAGRFLPGRNLSSAAPFPCCAHGSYRFATGSQTSKLLSPDRPSSRYTSRSGAWPHS